MRKLVSMFAAALLLALLTLAPALTARGGGLWAQDAPPGEEDEDAPPIPAIVLIKSVSVDGGASWADAEIPTGPIAEVGAPVSFLLEVINAGDVPLSEITLTDSALDVSGCAIPAVLEAEQSFDCVLGPIPAVEGQQRNVATVTATTADGVLLSDADAAHYFVGSRAALVIEKSVSIGGGDGAWYTADSAPGPIVPSGFDVSFRFEVVNEGTEVLNAITLTDSMYDVSGCAVPASLAPGESFECQIGPFEVEGGDDNDDDGDSDDDDGGDSDDDDGGDGDAMRTFVNVATVTGTTAAGETITATDEAYFSTEGDDDDRVIIIIEGPITEIRDNIIVIFDIDIIIDRDDPILTVIRIGDIIRIEGERGDDDDDDGGTTVIIIAIIIVIIDVDIYIDDDGKNVYRDDGDCGNGPPPWAPAHGWRAKCQVIIIDSDRGPGRGRGRGRGRGGDDDDGDDDD